MRSTVASAGRRAGRGSTRRLRRRCGWREPSGRVRARASPAEALVLSPSRQRGGAQRQRRRSVVRVEFDGALERLGRRLESPGAPQQPAAHVPGVGIPRVEPQRVLDVRHDRSIEGEPRGRLSGPGVPVRRLEVTNLREHGVRLRERRDLPGSPMPSRSAAWASASPVCGLVGCVRQRLPIAHLLAGQQVQVVGDRITRSAAAGRCVAGAANLGSTARTTAPAISDCTASRSASGTVVALGPQHLAVAAIHQLHRHPQAPPIARHRALEQRRDGELGRHAHRVEWRIEAAERL
jgi:hypothetical protein